MALSIGQSGWLILDLNGAPTGEPVLDQPELGTPAIQVIGVVSDPLAPLPAYAGILTLTGAPITSQMSAQHELWDAGMLERNPIPEETP